jgi:CubicO group peptidase (beta-lactamase class C family)
VSAGTRGATQGHITAGFEKVAEALEGTVAEGGERGLSVAAYVDGEPVVDAWCGDWAEDSVALSFSCTKGLTALCAHMLIDRGLLDPEAPVVTYWPEYGANGKEATLVRHIMNHSAGVLTFPSYWEVIDADGHGLEDTETIIARLAAAPPSWEPGTAVAYHALTYGWLLGEVVRRIDGRTVGRFFAEEVAGLLGLDLWIGSPASIEPRVLPSIPPAPIDDPEAKADEAKILADTLPRLAANDFSTPEAMWLASVFFPREGGDVAAFLAHILNQPFVRAAEVPGANAVGNARSLARLYAALSLGGSLAGTRLVSAASIPEVTAHRPLPDGSPTGFGLGYALASPEMLDGGASEASFGHSGAGGQMGFADPVRHVSFGLVKTQMQNDNATGARLIEALYSCL